MNEAHSPDPVLPAAQDPARGARLRKIALGVTLLGLVLSAAALAGGDWSRFGTGYLIGYVFCWAIVLGSLFFVALQHITGSVWSVGMRRVAEMLAAPMWLLALLFVPLAILAWTQTDPAIFPWMDAHHAHGLDAKAPYLNKPFFVVRTAVFFLIWVGFAFFFVRQSIRQDDGQAGAGATLRMRKAAAPFLVLFAFTLTFASFDWLMSLAPHWFSTIFGVYVFSGVTLAALAAITLAVLGLRARGQLGEGVVRGDHLYSLGALLFAFTCFWAYIAFSQYMLIWYGNIPEETVYFVQRLEGGWYGVSVAVALLRFVVPFFLLLPRSAKSDPRRLVLASVIVLVGQLVDLYWVVMPQTQAQAPRFGFSELGPAVLLLGLLGLQWAAFLRRHRPVAIGDPAFEKSRRFHL